jgi:hypothetical protein
MRPTVLDAADRLQAGAGSPVVVTLAGGAQLAARIWRGWLRFEGSGCIEAATRHAFEPVRQPAPPTLRESSRWPGCDAPRVRLQLQGSTFACQLPDLGARVVPIRAGGDRWKP